MFGIALQKVLAFANQFQAILLELPPSNSPAFSLSTTDYWKAVQFAIVSFIGFAFSLGATKMQEGASLEDALYAGGVAGAGALIAALVDLGRRWLKDYSSKL